MKKHNAGMSLVEVLVAIVLLGAMTVPICTSLVVSIKVNDKTEAMLQAQLDVSSAVEHLMATGVTDVSPEYDVAVDGTDMFPDVTVVTEYADENNTSLPYYKVTVTDNDSLVSVTTFIRKNGGA